jgi:hypothetical protein
MMTGQPPGARRVAILSARAPAQSRNSTPGQVQTQPLGPLINGQGRLLQEPAGLEKIQVTAQDEGADRSVADGLDRQGVRVHRFSIGSRGLDDTK